MAGQVTLEFFTVDVFTGTRFRGNPLAIVLVPAKLRDSVDQQTKQRIAAEFNLSETVFLHTPDEPDTSKSSLDINIFTIEEELPFAGHPTIGTAYLVLEHLKWAHVKTLVTKAGPIPIRPTQNGRVQAEIPHDVHIHKQTLRGVLSAAGASGKTKAAVHAGLAEDETIRAAELDGAVVSIVKGLSFVLVRLPDLAHLAKVNTGRRLRFGDIPDLLDDGPWGKSFVSRYYYVPGAEPESESESGPNDGTSTTTHRIRARMVELAFEDPATGSAACTLGSYLALSTGADRVALELTQGVEMGRKSDVAVEVATESAGGEGGEPRIKGVSLGGEAVVVMNGKITA